MTFLDLAVLVFGSYRLFVLVAEDEITRPLRERWLGYNDDGKSNNWPRQHKTIGEFIHCPWCLGFWISLAAAVAWHEWPHATWWVLLPFAISSLVALTSVVFHRVVLDE